MPWVYILRCSDDTYYTGATTDLGRRLLQHQAGRASRYTRVRRPVEMVWSRRCGTWGRALSEEHRIKHLRRAEKEALIRTSRQPRDGKKLA